MKMSKALLTKLYTNMVRIKELDTKMMDCLLTGKLATFYHSCAGQEAPGVALCELLAKDDFLFYQHRGHGINKCLPRGMTAKELLAEHFGRASGANGGMAGFHYAKPELGIMGMGGTVGGEITLATGTALACKLNNKGQISVSCFGDGATGRGTLHESMLMASTWKLPIIFFCENNSMAQWTHLKLTHPTEDLIKIFGGYGMPANSVNGQDILEVYKCVKQAVERARKGKGPTFLEIKTLRFRGHVEGFPDYSVECEDGCRPVEERERMKKYDPINLFKNELLSKYDFTEEELSEIERSAKLEMDEAEQFAIESPWPEKPDFQKLMYAD